MIRWLDEDRESIIPWSKIVRPAPEDRAVGTMCSVKGFEKHLSQIVAFGQWSVLSLNYLIQL